jgi:SAM-dependent methyltransferase
MSVTLDVMSLSSYYKRQFSWRDWPRIFEALPSLQGRTVLDLGCGVGHQAAEMVARGARVIGIDMSEEVLREAQSRRLPNSEFRLGDLRTIPELGVAADGVWSSFSAAYFPDFPVVLAAWGRHLRPGGWIALTEIDDFFGHEPLGDRTKALFEAYAGDAFKAGRYDFHMGGKLQGYLERSGFTATKSLTLEDQELSFSGPARPEVVDAWRTRLDGMKLLHKFCGPSFEQVREEFLECLALPEHRSRAKVHCYIATR